MAQHNERFHNLDVDHDSAIAAICSDTGKGIHRLIDAHAIAVAREAGDLRAPLEIQLVKADSRGTGNSHSGDQLHDDDNSAVHLHVATTSGDFHDFFMFDDYAEQSSKSFNTTGPANHDNLQSDGADMHMQQIHRVQLNEAVDYHLATAFSEMYHDHPHVILASASGWKINPSRAEIFIGNPGL